MTYLTLISQPSSASLKAAQKLAKTDTLDEAYAAIVAYRDATPCLLTDSFRAVILDDNGDCVSRLQCGDGADVVRALATAWGVRSTALLVHVWRGADRPDDETYVPPVITAAELIGEGDDLPQDDEVTDPVDNSVDDPVDNSEEEEIAGVTVEEAEEQP
ncbi:MAG: hypothetical protein AABZ76_07330 [Pseudomonadota bacterium]